MENQSGLEVSHEHSCLRLVAMLLMESNQDWTGRIYLRMEEEAASLIEAPAAEAA